MKKSLLLSFLSFILYFSLYSQVSQSFQYQVVVRDISGSVLINQPVNFRISIISGILPGTIEYVETHTSITNAFGVVTLAVGNGTPVTNLFSDIDWSLSIHHLKVEIDPNSSGYIDMGTTQLLSVPYSLYSENAGNIPIYTGGTGINVAGTTITNIAPDQIVSLTQGGSTTVTGTYPNFTVSSTDNNSGTPGGLNKTIQFNNSGSFGGDTTMIWDNANKRLGLGVTNPTGRMVIQGSSTAPANEPLFEIKNSIGQQVMAVYNDSIHFFITDIASNRGGFAVSGRSNAKSITNNFFNISTNLAANNVNSKARILWYPNKEAFLTGRVLIEGPDSVGTNSFASGFESKSIGNWSQALGYKARAFGVNSTAIGNYANAEAPNSFALGDSAIAKGIGSFAIGSVGRQPNGTSTGIPTTAAGIHSISIGMGAYTDTVGAVALGNQARAEGNSSIALGYKSHALGNYSLASGNDTWATGDYSVSLGYQCTAAEDNSVAIGYLCHAHEFGVAMGNMTEATGWSSTTSGYLTKANNGAATAFGENTVASGYGSFVSGIESRAGGRGSVAFGWHAFADGDYSFALGDLSYASNYYSFSFGDETQANGQFSYAFGKGIHADGTNTYAIALNDQTSTVVTQANTMAIMGGNVGIHTVSPAYRLDVVGDIRSTNKIFANANGAAYFQGGDDAEIWDVNVANTLAIYGIQNPALATLRLGNSGADISGSNGNVGIGTIGPNVKMDINGGIALRQTTLAQITAGPVSNYNIGAGSYFRISSNATYAIGGITGGVDGKIIVITNVGAFTINFNNETLTSTAVNRFANSTGAQIALAPNGTITYIYDAVSQRWRDIAFR